MPVFDSFVAALAEIALLVIEVYIWMIIAYAIMTWLIGFNVINRSNRFIFSVGQFLHQVTEPALRQIRKIIPTVGGIDFSPAVLLLLLFFLRNFIYRLIV